VTSAIQTNAVGSFAIEAPLPLDDPGLGHVRAFRVIDGQQRSGIAYASPLSAFDQSSVERLRSRLDRRAQLTVPGLAPALETGLTESAAFIVEPEPSGEPLDHLIARVQRLTPFDALAVAAKTAATLNAAQFPHGQLSSALVWIDDESLTLTGFAFDEPAPGTDAAGLAGLVFEMLSGRRFDADAFPALPAARADRIRESLPGVSVSLAAVINDGTRGRYSSIAEIVSALDAAREESIVLLADAANQSLSLKDPAGAGVFLDVARTYDSNHPAIKTVEARLAAGAKSAPLPPIDPIAPPQPQPPAFDHGYEPGSEQALFLERLRASVPDAAPAQDRKPIPWFAIAAGAVGVFAILTVIMVVVAYAS
jgi:hypothetical protein